MSLTEVVKSENQVLMVERIFRDKLDSFSIISKINLVIVVAIVCYSLFHFVVCISRTPTPTEALQSSYALFQCAYLLFAMSIISIIVNWRISSWVEDQSPGLSGPMSRYVIIQICLGVGLLLASYLFVQIQKHDYYGGWFRVYTISFNEFTHREYLWAIEDSDFLDLSSSNSISYCAMMSRDSGSYRLWKIQIDRNQWKEFKEENTELVYGSSEISYKLQPVRDWQQSQIFSSQSIDCEWWAWNASKSCTTPYEGPVG